jgi:kynurenine 3-monooxygenase
MNNTIIVGAGLVGSLLSVYLARAGFKVSVYERFGDPLQGESRSGRSVNITLSTRGFQALDAVGLGDTVRQFCVPAYGRVIHSQDGRTTYQPYGNHQEALYSIRRDDLSKILLDFARSQESIEFYFNHKCLDLDLPTGTLTLQDVVTDRIERIQAEKIFAADGAYSAVRQKMQRLKGFNYSQEYFDQGYKEIVIPPDSQGNWPLDRNALHIWPRDRFMLIGFPNLDKSFTLSLHLPYQGEISHESIDSPQAIENLFKTYFPDIWESVRSNLANYFASPVETMVTIKCFPWSYQDKVALIGDACHAILPSYGQGANAGFEDCQLLARCIQQHLDNWQDAFKAYETARKPDMDAIAHLCVEHFTVLHDAVGNAEFQERNKLERQLQILYPDYAPIYYNIAFTDMSYRKAWEIERSYRNIIDEMLENRFNSATSIALESRQFCTIA